MKILAIVPLALTLFSPTVARAQAIVSGGSSAAGLTTSSAAATYVNKSGDTMTGRLIAPDATLTYGLTAATGSFSNHVVADTLEVGAAGNPLSWSRNFDINSAAGSEIGFRLADAETYVLGGYPGYFGLYNNGASGFSWKTDTAHHTHFTSGVTASSVSVTGAAHVIGSVGIGTASPGTKLHVSSGIVTVDGTSSGINIDKAGDSVLHAGTGNYGTGLFARYIGTWAGFYMYDSEANALANGATGRNIYGEGGTGMVVSNATKFGFSSTADAAGSVDVALSRVGTNSMGVGTGAVGSYAGTLLAGSVGIGTASPCSTCTLHVAGGASVTNGLQTDGGIVQFQGNHSAGKWLKLKNTAASVGTWEIGENWANGTLSIFNANWTAPTNPFNAKLNDTESKVGIWDSSPDANLEILANKTAPDSYVVLVSSNNDTDVLFGVKANGEMRVNGSTFTVATTGIVSAPSQPGVRAKSSGVSVLTNGVASLIYFGAEDYDRQNMHDVTASSSAFTVPTGGAGLYYVQCDVDFAASGGAAIETTIYVDGGLVGSAKDFPNASTDIVVSASGMLSLTAGQVLTCKGQQGSGSDTNACNSILCRFNMVKVW